MKIYVGVEVKLHHYTPRYYIGVSGQLRSQPALPRGKLPPSIH
jgi:hypothetical protein